MNWNFLSARSSFRVISCLFVAILFGFLGWRELASSHEARAAQESQRFLDAGDWLPPRLYDDQPDFQKPPLFYLLVAGSASLHGGRVTAFDVRLPSFLAAVGCVVLIYGWLAARGRPFAGIVAAVSLATMHHFAWLGQVGRVDMPLTLAATAGLLALLSDSRRLLGVFALTVGVLLKGPVALALPVAVLTAFAVISRSWTPVRTLVWVVPTVLLLASPWFIAAEWHSGGEFGRIFFGRHHLARVLGGDPDGPHAASAHPWWYYGPRLAVDVLPWTPVFALAVVLWVRSGQWRTDIEGQFGLIWAIVIVLLLSGVRFKRADYLLPAYPGLAIALGCAVESFRWRPRVLLTAVLLFSALGWLTWHVAHCSDDAEPRRFAAEVRSHCPAPETILFFRVEAHALSWHLGRPQNTFREWENLDVWAGRPGTHYLVMTPDAVAEWPAHVRAGQLVEVTRSRPGAGHGGEPLVLMRTHIHLVSEKSP